MRVGQCLVRKRATLAVAESCTGGLIGQRVTSVSGSSRYFRGGIVAYANDVKQTLLNVPASLLRRHGAVSAAVAAAMARGVRRCCRATHGLAATGIAGPRGGTRQKPVGRVYVAVACERGTVVREFHFAGSRARIRHAACHSALKLLLDCCLTAK